jgi:hypothetical protein
MEPCSKAKRKVYKRLEAEDFICEECSKIDFQKVRDLNAQSLQLKHDVGVFIANLGMRFIQSTGPACALCRVFSSVYPLCGIPLWEEYELRAYSFLKYSRYTSLYHCPKTLKAKDHPLLAVVSANTRIKMDDLERWKIGHPFSYGTEAGHNQSHLFTPQIVSS